MRGACARLDVLGGGTEDEGPENEGTKKEGGTK
jgi:hypothetical protein